VTAELRQDIRKIVRDYGEYIAFLYTEGFKDGNPAEAERMAMDEAVDRVELLINKEIRRRELEAAKREWDEASIKPPSNG
jgi:hypothetical protein